MIEGRRIGSMKVNVEIKKTAIRKRGK